LFSTLSFYRQITGEILLKTNSNTLLHNGPISSTTQTLTTAVIQSCTVVSSKQHSSCTAFITVCQLHSKSRQVAITLWCWRRYTQLPENYSTHKRKITSYDKYISLLHLAN